MSEARPDRRRAARNAPRVVASGLFGFYLLWNLYWLAHGRFAPSIFLGFTGLPGPTTGWTRGLLNLLRGEWGKSLSYNAMTVPILVLLVFCVALLAVQLARRRPLRLPNWTLWAWLLVLGVSWALKLTGSPAWW